MPFSWADLGEYEESSVTAPDKGVRAPDEVFSEAITELWRTNNEPECSMIPTGLDREAAEVNSEKPLRFETMPSLRITTLLAISIAPGGTRLKELGLRKSPLKSEMFTVCIDSSCIESFLIW